MPKYMSIHRAPGLLEEQWLENAAGVYAGQHARFVQAHVNLASGFIFTIYEAQSAEKVQEQFEELGLPFEEMHEIRFSQSFDEMVAMLKKAGKL